MSLRFRRWLLISFIILFILSAIVVVFYTSGYRYNWQRKILQKTSLLVLDSVPTKAEISLNGQELQKTTPQRLSNLLPNEYLVEIKKEGFQPWSKKLLLEPNRATFAENIILFKANPQPETIYQTEEISALKILPTTNFIYLVEKHEGQNNLIKFDFLNRQRLVIFTTDYQLKITNFNSNQEKILIQDDQEMKILNLLTQEVETNLTTNFQPLNILAVKWSPSINYELLVKTTAGLYLFSLVENKKTLLTEKYVLDFSADNQRFYYLTNQNESTVFWVQNFGATKPQATIKLPNGLDYQIIDAHENLLTVLNPQDQYLYLLELSGEKLTLEQTFNQATQAQWTPETKHPRLLYYNDHEIYVYDYDYTKEKYYAKILARYPTVINQVIWHPAYYHLIFHTENSLKAIELDERDKNNVFPLYQTPISPKLIFTNPLGDNLYLWLTEDGQDKIIQLSITETSGWFFNQ